MPRIGYEARLEQLHRLAMSQCRDLETVAIAPDGTEIWRTGGRWNHALRRYVGRAHHPSTFRLNGAQNAGAAQALAAWMRAFVAREPRMREIALTGPRGPGKTVLAVAAAVAAAYLVPRSTHWLISPTFTVRHELDRDLALVLPDEDHATGWLQAGWKERDLVYTLPNGSRFVHKSADQPERLKDGGFTTAVANEFALWKSDTAAMMVGGLRNEGGHGSGLIIPTWNPAVIERGGFTEEHAEAIDRGDLDGLVELFELDPALNEYIDASYSDDIDRLIRSFGRNDIADADARGVRRRVGEMATPDFRAWPAERMVRMPDGAPRGGHIGAPPELGFADVTAEVSDRLMRARGRAGMRAQVLIGADFQRRPHCIGVAFKIYRRHDGRFLFHAIAEHLADKGYEDELAEKIIEEHGRQVLVIGDGNGATRDARQRTDTGRTSFDALREHGLVVIPVVDPSARAEGEAGRNPDVQNSLGQIADILLDDRILVSPSCTWGVECLTKCRVKHLSGRVRLDDRFPGHSHWVDCLRYVAHRVEPKRGPTVKQLVPRYQSAGIPRRRWRG